MWSKGVDVEEIVNDKSTVELTHSDETMRHSSHSVHTHTHTHSPYQDDFVVVHVRDEYDSVLESVLKTEFLTLLSEKYTTLTRSTLTVHFGRRSVMRSHNLS